MSSDNLSDKKIKCVIYIISNGCYTYGQIHLLGGKLLTFYLPVCFLRVTFYPNDALVFLVFLSGLSLFTKRTWHHENIFHL